MVSILAMEEAGKVRQMHPGLVSLKGGGVLCVPRVQPIIRRFYLAQACRVGQGQGNSPSILILSKRKTSHKVHRAMQDFGLTVADGCSVQHRSGATPCDQSGKDMTCRRLAPVT